MGNSMDKYLGKLDKKRTKEKKQTNKQKAITYQDDEDCSLYPDECDGQRTDCNKLFCPWGSEYC